MSAYFKDYLCPSRENLRLKKRRFLVYSPVPSLVRKCFCLLALGILFSGPSGAEEELPVYLWGDYLEYPAEEEIIEDPALTMQTRLSLREGRASEPCFLLG